MKQDFFVQTEALAQQIMLLVLFLLYLSATTDVSDILVLTFY